MGKQKLWRGKHVSDMQQPLAQSHDHEALSVFQLLPAGASGWQVEGGLK
jgi:hypothetical protein